MRLIPTFVELGMVVGRRRKRAGSPQAVSRRTCCSVVLRRTAWAWHGMASVNQKRPHCVNEMGKTHSKPLVARHGRGTAWARHVNGMLCVNRPLNCTGRLLVPSEKVNFARFTLGKFLELTRRSHTFLSRKFPEVKEVKVILGSFHLQRRSVGR